MARLLAFAATILGLWGCSSTNFLSNGSTSDKADDGRRPSEQGEGVVGYLRDPGTVDYRDEGGAVIVSAPAGAVGVYGDGDVDGLPVCLQQASRDAVRGVYEASAAFGGEGIKTLVDGLVASDGSFSLEVAASSLDPALLLAINVAGDCTAESAPAWNPTANSVVFKDFDQGGGFGSAGDLFPEIVLAITGTICKKKDEFDGCDQPFTFYAEDELGNKVLAVTASIWRADAVTTDDTGVEPESSGTDGEEPPPMLALEGDTDTGGIAPDDVGTATEQKLELVYGETYWAREGEVHVTFYAEPLLPAEATLTTAADWGKTVVLERN